jgi:hypothetical protein
MVVGLDFYVVVELLDVIDPMFCFYVTVLGDPEIDTNSRFISRLKIQFGAVRLIPVITILISSSILVTILLCGHLLVSPFQTQHDTA